MTRIRGVPVAAARQLNLRTVAASEQSRLSVRLRADVTAGAGLVAPEAPLQHPLGRGVPKFAECPTSAL
jgi:hypothetical protein